MSFVTRRIRDVDVVSTTNPGSTLADVVQDIQVVTTSVYSFTFQPLTGAVDDVNKVFTLAVTPDEGSVSLYMNGVLLHPGAENDYEIVGNTVTLADALRIGSSLWANYKLTVVV